MPDSPPLFDDHADDYEAGCMRGLSLTGENKAFFANARLDHLARWWETGGRSEPDTIVDFGCGIGDVTRLLAERFPRSRVYGLDPSEKCVQRAAGEYADDRVSFHVLGDDRDPAIQPAGLVHINGVVHHVAPSDRPSVMALVRDHAAAGGVVAVFENNPANPGTRWVMSRIPFDRDAVPLWSSETRRHMKDVGLRVLGTSYLMFFPRFLSLLRPLERYLVRVPLGGQYVVLAEAP
jgi:SAM-dependent methyltransferase